VLGTEVIDPDANFFELGGHSLLAARMLGRLESAFGEKVGLTVLFRTPTLRGLARLVAAQRPVVDEAQIVQVQPSGSEPPIFALYNTGIFYTLANRLGRERPFIAIQLLDPEKPQSLPERSLQEIAAEYVRAMRSVRPHGPYIVLGLCIAGVIAYEVARQLQADGEEVSLLIVIDAWAPGYVRQLSRRQAFLADISFRAQVIGAELVKVARGRLGFLEWCASKRIVRRIGVLKAAARLGIIRPVPLEPDLWLVEYLTGAIRSYEPQGYDGRTLLFYSPEQPSGRFLDRTLGWRRVCTGPLDCVVIPGDHLGLFQDPGATLMANRILAEIGLASDAESSELAARYRT
jgi:thioesterase domain-containing protein/acyl carrier protein